MIRVLVVDDSLTARTLLVALSTADPGKSKSWARRPTERKPSSVDAKLRPDRSPLDFACRALDGFQATKEIMITTPTPIIIVTASVARGEVQTSMDSLLCRRSGRLGQTHGTESAQLRGNTRTRRRCQDALPGQGDKALANHRRAAGKNSIRGDSAVPASRGDSRRAPAARRRAPDSRRSAG